MQNVALVIILVVVLVAFFRNEQVKAYIATLLGKSDMIKEEEPEPEAPVISVPVPATPEPKEEEAKITNQLPSCLNTNVGTHDRVTLGKPVGNGPANVTTLSVFDKDATGVLPQNHDLFETPAQFGSDVTNINQFYNLNPDVFQRTIGSPGIQTASDWESQGNRMWNDVKFDNPEGLQPANFEDNPAFAI